MLKHWLFDLIGHVSGLSDAQLRQIEKSLPASKALIDLLNRAEPMIEQAQKLYAEAEPLIDEAMKELQTVGPAVQILIDVIGHHVNKGGSPAEAAEAVRAAFNGSIKSVAQDHSTDLQMSRVVSSKIAALKAADAGLDMQSASIASDAFFPFRDGLDTLAELGIKSVIQPGGSKRDADVIAAADEHGIAMVFTGMRHFRH